MVYNYYLFVFLECEFLEGGSAKDIGLGHSKLLIYVC